MIFHLAKASFRFAQFVASLKPEFFYQAENSNNNVEVIKDISGIFYLLQLDMR